ncbi:hypothetical protein GN958_ATG02381 [Phytophthora infestans]|uniref:Uncharacterized protein n=1 Tax=Phytophthora infestans TaxID=4787 RepID=A0A8S9V622_PHYIN|nr:hypothetical protein GN958_ATG23174 [Phytophthora infestans]KAF4148440.1 hypothetical protein GN958_ATG02381 [Phytophthora infestans]
MSGTPSQQDGYEEENSRFPADTNPAHLATVTKPPPSLWLPTYYTQRRHFHQVQACSIQGKARKSAKPVDNGTAATATTRRTPKPKMAGMRKSSAISVDKVVTEALQTTTQSTSKPKAKRASKNSQGGSKGKEKADTTDVKTMKWTVQLTALAIEARFQNKQILKKFATKNSNTKAQRAMWEDTITVFQQRALLEHAWGDDEPRSVTVKQLKNKLDAVRAAYKAKRGRMLATGNHPPNSDSSSDEGDDTLRKYPEMPVDFFVDEPDKSSDSSAADSGGGRKLTCKPTSVHPTYLKELGADLAALWPLLCGVFSRRLGCTGEAFMETGVPARGSLPTSESDDDDHAGDDNVDSDSCESPTEAREKAKAAAKAKKQRDKQYNNVSTKRPADVMSDTLKTGFEAIERVFSARHQPSQDNGEISRLVQKLTSSIDESNAKQQANSDALLTSIAGLHQATAGFYSEMAKWMQNQSNGS